MREAEGRAVAGAALHELAELAQLARERGLGGLGQDGEVAVEWAGTQGHGVHAQLLGLGVCHAGGAAQDRTDAGVSVLHVVDRVGVVLALHGLDVEVDHLVGALGDEREARGVGTHLVEQLAQRHHRALALAHLDGLAVAQQVHELAEQHLELALVAKCVGGGAHAGDVAVVVGAPHVDDVVDALVLVPVVGHVGGEVGVLAVLLHEHAVLVVAEVGGAEPQGPVLLVEVALLAQAREGAVDGTRAARVLLVEGALGEPDVEGGAHVGAGVADVVEHELVAALAEGEHALGGVGLHPLGAVHLHEVSREVDDVVAAVGVGAELVAEAVHVGVGLGMLVLLVVDEGLPVGDERLVGGVRVEAAAGHDVGELKVALGHRVAEDVHLVAVVVHVVLALDRVAGVLEHARERVAERRPAAVADVERAHGVGRHELHLHLGAVAEVRAAKVRTLLARGAEDLVAGRGREVEVHETGAGHLGALDGVGGGQVGHDGLGDLARRHVRGLGRAQRHRAGPVPVGGVRRALEAEVGHLEGGQVSGPLRGSDGGADKRIDRVDHGGPFRVKLQVGRRARGPKSVADGAIGDVFVLHMPASRVAQARRTSPHAAR